MCAYNAVDNQPACASKLLLSDILRKDWNFQGFVTSDCGAIDDFFKPNAHKTSPNKEAAAAAGIKAGTDTNCGNTYTALTAAVKRGDLTEAEIDTSVKRLFTARFRLGMFDPAASVPWSSIPMSEVESEAHRALAAEAADKSMVLLKNNGTLPLKSTVRTLAVIGPNAASLSALEGNYNAIPRAAMLPVDAIAAEFPHAKILYAQGAPYDEGLQLPVPRTAFHTAGAFHSGNVEGLEAEYFPGGTFATLPAVTRVDKQIDFDWMGASPAPDLAIEHFAVRWTGTLTAARTTQPAASPSPSMPM